MRVASVDVSSLQYKPRRRAVPVVRPSKLGSQSGSLAVFPEHTRSFVTNVTIHRPWFVLTWHGKASNLRPAMKHELPHLLCVLLIFLLAVAEVGAQPHSLAPQEGILILRTGSVLRGTITRSGDRYYVALPDAEIRIRVTDVELFCTSLDEAYRLKSEVIKPGDVDQRLELSEWCIRYNLLGSAARELAMARSENPRHPRLELIERRLRIAADPSTLPASSQEPGRFRSSGEELNQWVRGLPPGAVETFTNHVQPLLLNRCATGGCHGAAATNQLRLERTGGGRPISRSITYRNLEAVLQCINRDDAAASPLLKLPLESHGGTSGAIFQSHDLQQYQLLAIWVQAISRVKQAAPPATVEHTAAPLLQQMSPTDLPPNALPNKAADDTTPSSMPTAEPFPEIAPEANQAHHQPRVQRGAPLPEPVAQDPFDPAIFNQQFSSQR